MNVVVLENAIQQYKAEKEQRKKVIEQELGRTKIASFNMEIDSSLSKALQEVQAEADKEKADLAQKAEKKKKEFAISTIAIESAKIDNEYDNIISNLEKLLENIKEQ